MTTKLQKCARAVNDAFGEKTDAAFVEKFGIELETNFNILAFAMVSRRSDGEAMTPEQHAFVVAYSNGYADAKNIVEQSQ